MTVTIVIPFPALAWDSIGHSSHDAITENALNKVIADPLLPVQLKANLGWGYSTIVDYCAGEGEAIHPQLRTPFVVGPDSYSSLAVGNNGGTDHPEYWWQSTVAYYRLWQSSGNEAYRIKAYQDLGRVVHAIEDQGAPPHAWNTMHSMTNFEILSFVTSYDTTYYKQPTAIFTDGKNVVDVDNHGDRDYFVFSLNPNVYGWTYTGLTTNLQTPAAKWVEVTYAIDELLGIPDQVYLRITYDTTHGEVIQTYGPLSPRYGRKSIMIYDDFAPNGNLRIDYQRQEDGYSRTGQIGVYVRTTKDITDGLVKPTLNNPWEYYDWMKDWTLQNTAAPYWQRYWTLGGWGDLSYDITWATAPNTERALLSEQWAASEQAIRWFLEDAQAKLDDPGYTVEQAAGNGIRVVLYDDHNYNSDPGSDTEFTYSQPIVYEPDSNSGRPLLDSNFVLNRNGGWASIESPNLGFMANRISSIEIRGTKALSVTLFSDYNYNGASKVLVNEIPDLTAIGFNDLTRSMKIQFDPYPPTSGSYSLSGPVNENGWYKSDMVTLSGASDDGSGLSKVVYKLDSDTEWTDYETPFHLEDGVHTLHFEGIDNVGNIGPLVTATIKVDTAVPQTTLNLSINQYGWAKTDRVGLDASDSLSGVAETLYKLDADDWVKYTAPFQVSEGSHTVLYKTIDMAGNVEAGNSASFRIDVTRPVITVNAPGMAQYYLDDTMIWDWTATDYISGVLSQDGPGVGSHIDTSRLGTHSYAITASDVAGNSITRTVSYSVRAAPTVIPTASPIVTPAPVPTVTPAPTPDTGDTGGAVTPTPTPTPEPASPSTEKTVWPGNLLLVLLGILALAGVGIWYFTRQK